MANPAMPDFWRYYGNKKLSDLTVVLLEEDAAPATSSSSSGSTSKRKRQDGEQHCGHGVVLAAFSGYCRTKLEEWDAEAAADDVATGSRAPKRQILMPVPAGQLDVGRLLLRGIYQQQPELQDVSQAVLIELLLLADQFDVPKVQAAVSAAFKALPPEQLQWETVMAVYGLPAGCAELAACRDLFSAAAAKLQHELGDLELALEDPESSKAQQLLALPFGAAKQLLQDERTHVASENTVYYAIQQWHKHQQQQQVAAGQQRQRSQSLRQQTQELLQLVHMPQCSQLFIVTVVGQNKLATSFFSPGDLLVANTFSTHGSLPQEAAGLPAFQRHPAWLLPARPASLVRRLTIGWKPPLAELRAAFQELQQGAEVVQLIDGRTRVWQALHILPDMWLERSSAGEAASYSLHGGCRFGLRGDEARRAAVMVWARRFDGAAHAVIRYSKLSMFSQERLQQSLVLLDLGAVGSWAAAEAVLRERELVGADGHLQLRLWVMEVDRALPSSDNDNDSSDLGSASDDGSDEGVDDSDGDGDDDDNDDGDDNGEDEDNDVVLR